VTAYKKYQRLEAAGLWCPGPKEQRREVIASFGKTTLIISDMQDRTLTHWSLAAIERQNSGEFPAVYSPYADCSETLEFAEDEDHIILALEELQRAITRARPHPGRLRMILLLMSALAVIALIVFWMPRAIVSHALAVVPDVTRAEIGLDLLDQVNRISGPTCAAPHSLPALERLVRRVGVKRIVVLPSGLRESFALPGGIFLLNRNILEDSNDPDIAAGFVLAEQVRTTVNNPLAHILETSGVMTSVRLITTGTIPQDTLNSYIERALVAERPPVDEQKLLAAFEKASVRSTPYAYAKDITGESVIGLIEADPMANIDSQPVLPDREWLLLQTICAA